MDFVSAVHHYLVPSSVKICARTTHDGHEHLSRLVTRLYLWANVCKEI